MINIVKMFRLLADETRVRILMLLTQRELCVCQIMGVLGVSQPLVSRNLALLSNAGVLAERREGKLVFYSVKREQAPAMAKTLALLRKELRNDRIFSADLSSLADCRAFQAKTGRCDMRTFLAFMEEQRRKRSGTTVRRKS